MFEEYVEIRVSMRRVSMRRRCLLPSERRQKWQRL